MEKSVDPAPSLSISAFFAGKTVLLTGATGFLAKAILEKILRDLPEVGRVILLVRGKGGEDRSDEGAWRRAETEVFGSDLFARLRREISCDFDRFVREKVECLAGDVRHSDLGLGAERYASLGEAVDLVINCAASVNFRERLDTAVAINVHGVKNLLEFARTAGALLVQVSTAYVCGQCDGKIEETVVSGTRNVDEEIADLRAIVERVERVYPDESSRVRTLIKEAAHLARARGSIDIYTYSKYLSECYLERHRGNVPVAIIRPSIIESSLSEPVPGWIEGLRMADPILLELGRGLSSFPFSMDAVIDVVPLDFVVKTTIAACAWTTFHPDGIRVFQITTGSVNPLLQREIIEFTRSYFGFPNGEENPASGWRIPPPGRFAREIIRRVRFLRLIKNLAERIP
ncbi:MAG: SDR family oxidoreductase, partial [Verrucomicrobiae bacterium]|nr:SDR family oxidoreductase [Verrucomicrobiae bacterium]